MALVQFDKHPENVMLYEKVDQNTPSQVCKLPDTSSILNWSASVIGLVLMYIWVLVDPSSSHEDVYQTPSVEH